jgi:hypothetical protein
MIGRAAPWAGALVLALLPTRAGAAGGVEPERVARPRFQIGQSFGYIGSNTLHVEHRLHQEEGEGSSAPVAVSYSLGLIPHLSAVGIARFGGEGSSWSQQRGERRLRGDLGLGPELWWRPRGRGLDVQIRLAFPFGPTFAWFRASERAVVNEEYSTGYGLNVGGILGLDSFWGDHGVCFEVGHARHLTWLTHRAALVSDPSRRTTEEYRYDQATWMVGVAYAYRL